MPIFRCYLKVQISLHVFTRSHEYLQILDFEIMLHFQRSSQKKMHVYDEFHWTRIKFFGVKNSGSLRRRLNTINYKISENSMIIIFTLSSVRPSLLLTSSSPAFITISNHLLLLRATVVEIVMTTMAMQFFLFICIFCERLICRIHFCTLRTSLKLCSEKIHSSIHFRN